MRVVPADPAAFTPQYDHELAAALARAGAEVELVTSRFRFGEPLPPDGYQRSEVFYPVSSRVFGRSRLRLPVRIAEHPFGVWSLVGRRPDVVHVQWLAAPPLDDLLLRLKRPSVFTAHDLLPRRTSSRKHLWRRLLRRFDRGVVHSAPGPRTLAGLGGHQGGLSVIPHPVLRSDPPRADDGGTALCLGVIRPYKGLDDAIAAVKQVPGARLVVAGDPLEPVDRYREAAGAMTEWRLGYLSERELDQALGEATVAVFSYPAELDPSWALLRALGRGRAAPVSHVR